jgi:predicted phosphodiesterase
MDRFAVIADVHGNRWALEAVLEDIERLGIDRVFNLGDVFYGPLDPAGTAALLLPRNDLTVCGNQDRFIFEDAPGPATLAFVRDQLGSDAVAWLQALESEVVVDGIWLGHGRPGADDAYLLWDVHGEGAVRRAPAAVAAAVSGVEASLFLCGHDHVPATMDLGDGRLVVDPGSVGLPAYDDEEPIPHVMRTGSPHARYAVVTRTDRGWRVTDRALPYDRQAAVDAATRNGREDWAAYLATGWAEPV